VYWPEDNPVFALKTDLQFYRTARDVSELLGGNIDIPPKLTERLGSERVRRSAGLSELSDTEAVVDFDEAVRDSFESVRDLYRGSSALIATELVDKYRTVQEKVLSCVSVVETEAPFAFFCLRGTEDYAPSWVFIREDKTVTTDLTQIVNELRSRLVSTKDVTPDNRDWTMAVARASHDLQAKLFDLLPHRNRRAMLVVRYCLEHLNAEDCDTQKVNELLRFIPDGKSSFQEDVDLEALSREALRVLRPHLAAFRARNARNRLKSISSLKREFRRGSFALTAEDISTLSAAIHPATRTVEQAAAAIIGIHPDDR
jgi:hypothetical protein